MATIYPSLKAAKIKPGIIKRGYNIREKVISVRNTSKSFQDGETERDILKNINFGLDVAQSCAILDLGSIKTTLLQAMAGLDNFPQDQRHFVVLSTR